MSLREVFLEVLTNKYSLNKKKSLQIIEIILNAVKADGASLSIRFVSDQKMVTCNKKTFKKNCSTDVISFPWHPTIKSARGLYLGDVVISIDRAYYHAPQYGTTFNDELVTYIIHGILHLIGYDDISQSKKKKMFQKQDELMNCLRKKGLLKRPIVRKG